MPSRCAIASSSRRGGWRGARDPVRPQGAAAIVRRPENGWGGTATGPAPQEAERGAALLLTFIMMLVLAGLALAVATFAQHSLKIGTSQLQDKQAVYIAEAGLERARQALTANTWTSAPSPGNAYTESFGAGEYRVTIVDNGNCDYGSSSCQYDITSEGYVPSQAHPVAKRQVTANDIDVTLSNTNLSLSATASASSEQASHPATDAKDGSNGSFWRANTQGSGQWLRMDLGSATTLNRIVIDENSNITGVTLESSSDGSSWSALSGLTGDGNNADSTWTFDFTATSARYFRATFTASSGSSRVSVEEFQSYNTSNAAVSLTNDGEFGTSW